MNDSVMTSEGEDDLLAPQQARALAALLLDKKLVMATAESCTGGLIGAACTDLPGSSVWFDRGFITYSNDAKTEMLCVDAGLITQHGAVSEPVARAMAAGALAHSKAQVAVAVTGVAGPTGGSPTKPVGTVWFGWATPQGVVSEVKLFAGNRQQVRRATLEHALEKLTFLLQDPP